MKGKVADAEMVVLGSVAVYRNWNSFQYATHMVGVVYTYGILKTFGIFKFVFVLLFITFMIYYT